MNMLFLCTGNSCRYIMAEAIFNHLAPDYMKAESAGSRPTGFVHPMALETLKAHGLKTSGLKSKSWNDIARPDIAITLCDNARGETCPLFLNEAIKSHWGLNDPATSNSEEAFEDVYRILTLRIKTFFNLYPDKKDHDFQKSLIEIGNLV